MLLLMWNGEGGCVLYQQIHGLFLGPAMSFNVLLRDADYQHEVKNRNGTSFTIAMRKKIKVR